MAEESYCIYDVLDTVRQRPAMYFGAKSIVLLQVYLYGYAHATRDHGVKSVCRPEFFGKEFFHDWVAARLGYSESTAGWCNMILAETLGRSPVAPAWENLARSAQPADEASALDRFYELLDQYRRECAS